MLTTRNPIILRDPRSLSKKTKIIESKNANHLEPNHTWGSNATNIPSSFSLVMTGCPDCSLVQLDSGTAILQELWGMLAKDGLARGIPRLKFQKDHLCSACELGKSKKSSHQPKAEDTNQEKVYLLHMDLCGPMRVASINGKRYILVIVDDYSRFTWVRFLRTKDVAPEAIIKCIKNIQVRLNATVRNNDVVERQNRTLIEAARTMLVFSKALLFLWAEAINTACYTQNRSLIRLRYNKTPYELLQDKKPDLSFFHVFGALCYTTNDNEDLGKLDAKADIGVVPNPIPQQPFQEAAAPRAIVLANSPVLTSIDQDAPSIKLTSQGSSLNVRQTHTLFEHLGRRTKDHPIANVI
ncbi:retrovirus-related pol polyprotein from transposon TNT 1-94, partial [Tanacetum coccineum]